MIANESKVSSEVVQTDLLDRSSATYFVKRSVGRRLSTPALRKNGTASKSSASVRFAEGTSSAASAQDKNSKDVAKRRLTSSDLALLNNGDDGEAAEGDDAAIANQTPNSHVKPIFDKFRSDEVI
jgi:hypothetical protein